MQVGMPWKHFAAPLGKPRNLKNNPQVWGAFLQVPAAYKRHGLISVRFPPNSGDLNPIETVWARLRRDLGQREREDLKVGRVISHSVFRQRVSQILQSYSKPSGEDRLNFYQRLLRGMPARLSKCRANKYGPCGK